MSCKRKAPTSYTNHLFDGYVAPETLDGVVEKTASGWMRLVGLRDARQPGQDTCLHGFGAFDSPARAKNTD